MDAVTYPQDKVIDMIHRYVIPLRIQSSNTKYMTQFNVKWTPAFVFLDSGGAENYRSIGFLDGDDFIALILLGTAVTLFNHEDYDDANTKLNMILEDFGSSSFVPEAIFYRGVARYKGSHKPNYLRHAYDKLTSEYPNNEWAKKAHPYRLIDA